MNTSKDIWQSLTDEVPPEAGFIRRRVLTNSPLNVFLALSLPNRRPAVLLEVATDSVHRESKHLWCAGFSLVGAPLDPARRDKQLLILELNDSRNSELFSILADDVLASLDGATDELSGVRVFYDRVTSWQDFFRQHKGDILSELEQHGLYGELWFLRHLLSDVLGPAAAISSWRGPEGANQDFHFSSCAVEVKTSTGNPPEKVIISNPLQLDDTQMPALFLAHLSLDVRSAPGESLPAIVSDIRRTLADTEPGSLAMFNTLLTKAGYLDSHSEHYGSAGYTLRYVHYYHVQGDFPRFRLQDVPSGVGDLRYSVVVSACTQFRVGEEELCHTMIGH